MHMAHSCPSFRAVADDNGWGYHAAMKTNPFIHHRSDTDSPREERRPTRFNDSHAIARKSLERWENEGGKIPELSVVSGRHAQVRAERF
jgi:hypothetical protein